MSLHRGHEHTDVEAGPIVKFAAILAFGTAASMGAMALLLGWFDGGPAGEPQPAHPLAATRPSFPEPRLQIDPAADMERWRAHEDEILLHYAWIDRERGLVRLPVARALEIVAERGIAAAEHQIRESSR